MTATSSYRTKLSRHTTRYARQEPDASTDTHSGNAQQQQALREYYPQRIAEDYTAAADTDNEEGGRP